MAEPAVSPGSRTAVPPGKRRVEAERRSTLAYLSQCGPVRHKKRRSGSRSGGVVMKSGVLLYRGGARWAGWVASLACDPFSVACDAAAGAAGAARPVRPKQAAPAGSAKRDG